MGVTHPINISMHPLYTSPALEYLSTIVRPEWKVFEYGGGGSTGYYGAHCSETCVVEHNDGWVEQIRGMSPSSVVHHIGEHHEMLDEGRDIDAGFYAQNFDLPIREGYPDSYNQYHGITNDEFRGYASYLAKYPRGYFDLIAVDGMARSLCLWYAAQLIKDGGIIILDNSDRWLFNSMHCYLINNGFNRKDFWQPGHPCWCTSFFSKSYDSTDGPCDRPVNTGDLYHFG